MQIESLRENRKIKNKKFREISKFHFTSFFLIFLAHCVGWLAKQNNLHREIVIRGEVLVCCSCFFFDF